MTTMTPTDVARALEEMIDRHLPLSPDGNNDEVLQYRVAVAATSLVGQLATVVEVDGLKTALLVMSGLCDSMEDALMERLVKVTSS